MISSLSRITGVVLIVLMATMTCMVALQIVLRYAFESPLSWGEEITRYMFIYLIFLGAANGIHRRIHVSIDALVIRLPSRSRRVMEVAAKLIVAALLLCLVVYGSWLVLETMGQRSPAMGIPIGLAYMAIPLGSLLGLVFVFAPKEEHTVEEMLA